MPNEKFLKEHPCFINPVRIPNVYDTKEKEKFVRHGSTRKIARENSFVSTPEMYYLSNSRSYKLFYIFNTNSRLNLKITKINSLKITYIYIYNCN